MTIGTSDGQQFDSEFDMQIARSSYQTAEANNPAFNTPKVIKDQSRVPPTMAPGAPQLPAGEFNQPIRYPGTFEKDSIDRTHDVPLAASAIIDKEGNPTGHVAIDKDIPPHPEFDQFVHMHEMAEATHMKNLIDAGQDPVEAYREAHDRIATPIETAAVRAHAVRTGRDPDQYLDEYKAHWREGASIAAEGPFDSINPDAHTTRYGLDKAELGGTKFAMSVGRTMTDVNPYAESEKLEGIIGGGRSMGAGKAIVLKPVEQAEGSYGKGYEIHQDGKLKASIRVEDRGKDLYVSGIYGKKNELGSSAMRSVLRQLKREFPEAETISGYRVSGARRQAGTVGTAKVDINTGRGLIKASKSKSESWATAGGPTDQRTFQSMLEYVQNSIDELSPRASFRELRRDPNIESALERFRGISVSDFEAMLQRSDTRLHPAAYIGMGMAAIGSAVPAAMLGEYMGEKYHMGYEKPKLTEEEAKSLP